jgi:hypothetical protein
MLAFNLNAGRQRMPPCALRLLSNSITLIAGQFLDKFRSTTKRRHCVCVGLREKMNVFSAFKVFHIFGLESGYLGINENKKCNKMYIISYSCAAALSLVRVLFLT